jgi:molybdenum cofactor biosynthesis enzyme MoaA
MPKEIFNNDYVYLPHSALLSFEEITRTAQSFIELGVEKIRLTGGEPLLRKNLEILIEQLAALKTLEGHPLDITLTTNGSLLARKAQALKNAGLKRVTVSLDGLDDAVFPYANSAAVVCQLVANQYVVDFLPFKGGHAVPENIANAAMQWFVGGAPTGNVPAGTCT